MLKMLPATCVGNVVTVEGMPVTSATILSNGVASSSGMVLIEEDKTYYIPLFATDIATVIQKLIDTITQLNNAITAIQVLTVTCAAPGSPSTIPVNVASFVTIGSSLTTLSGTLTTLKASLK
jgi:hypothetical protein